MEYKTIHNETKFQCDLCKNVVLESELNKVDVNWHECKRCISNGTVKTDIQEFKKALRKFNTNTAFEVLKARPFNVKMVDSEYINHVNK